VKNMYRNSTRRIGDIYSGGVNTSPRVFAAPAFTARAQGSAESAVADGCNIAKTADGENPNDFPLRGRVLDPLMYYQKPQTHEQTHEKYPTSNDTHTDAAAAVICFSTQQGVAA
jgi:hypothetical protein